MYKQILVTSIKAEKTFWMIMCCGSVCLGNAGELAGDSQTLTEIELRAGVSTAGTLIFWLQIQNLRPPMLAVVSEVQSAQTSGTRGQNAFGKYLICFPKLILGGC